MIIKFIRKVSMDMHILEAEDRISSWHLRYLLTLENAVNCNLSKNKLLISIKRIISKLKTTFLQNRMKYVIRWRRADIFKNGFQCVLEECGKKGDEKAATG